MEINLQCGGCGALLQTKDKTAIGYVPTSALDHDPILCQRCFQLRHYNKNVTVSVTSDDFLKMVSSIHEQKGIVIHLIDIFDVDGTLLRNIRRIVGNKPIYLVANKIDLLPKSINHHKLKIWLYKILKENKIKVEEIFFISAEYGYNVNELAMHLQSVRRQQDIYVVGVTNVGKSTFINQLIQRSTSIKEAITTSHFPGTTLDFIRIPLDQNSFMIDTPGIVNENQLTHYVSNEDLKYIIPKKEIKARNYQLNPEQTLYFGGIARLDFIKGERQPFVCYISNEIRIHRTKLSKADQLYERHLGELLSPPSGKTLRNFPKLVKQSYHIREAKTDIVFSGFGWVTILKGDVTVDVYYPRGLAVTIRKSFN